MPSIETVTDYFGAERAACLILLFVGLVGLELASLYWRRSRNRQVRAAAMTVAVIAALQLAVGAFVLARTPTDLARVTHAVTSDRAQVHTLELPRMHAVERNLHLLRGLWLGLMALGGFLLMVSRRGTSLRGVAMGVVPQAVLMLVFDQLASQRAHAYVGWLQQL